jgi:L-serine/L-threonine ammonia-lyase
MHIYSCMHRGFCSVLVPAYDHPTLWEGHSSMIAEIQTQLPRGVKPVAVFCSVGGGGLLGGVIKGCKDVGWDDGASSSPLQQ